MKAALFLALVLFIPALAGNVIVTVIAGTPAVILLGIEVLAVTGALVFSAVSLVTVAMVAFSSLQKQRVGANSPLALIIGVVMMLPSFWLLPFFPLVIGAIGDLLIAGLAGALSIVLLILSSRLIRREKMLP